MIDLIALDAETTGPNAFTARIVTLYAGVLRADGSIGDEVSLLVAPDGYDIPDSATDIHGISTEHARAHGVPLREALDTLTRFLQRHPSLPIGGHNIAYDLTLLEAEHGRVYGTRRTAALSHPILDSIVLDRALDKYRRGGRQLTQVAAHYGVPIDGEAHSAKPDAIAAGKIVQILIADPRIRDLSLVELVSAQVDWRAEQSLSLQQFLRLKDPTVDVDPGWPVLAGVPA